MTVLHGVDDAHCVEKFRNHLRGVEVVVHRLVAALLQSFDVLGGGGTSLQAVEVTLGGIEFLQSFLGRLQCSVAKVNGAAIRGLQHEIADSHRRICLLQLGMAAGKELVESDEVAERLAHLLSLDGDHIVVHPVAHGTLAVGHGALTHFRLVVREQQVHTAAVNVELLAQVLGAHGCTFDVPTRETDAPRGVPAHDVLGGGLLPQREVGGIAFLALTVQLASVGNQLGQNTTGKFAVTEILVKLLHIKIDGTFRHVSIARIKNFLYHLDLLDDVAGGARLDGGSLHVKRVHGFVVAVHIVLRHLHGFELLQTGLLGDLVLAFVSIVLQMAHVGDVAHITHLVADVRKVAEHHVESDGRARMSQMGLAIDRRSTDIKSHVVGGNGLEELFSLA